MAKTFKIEKIDKKAFKFKKLEGKTVKIKKILIKAGKKMSGSTVRITLTFLKFPNFSRFSNWKICIFPVYL